MAELIWTEPALSDLDEIAEYIAIENPSAAQDLVQQVFTVVGRLDRHPKSGRIPAELEGGRYREVLGGPCRVFYLARQWEESRKHVDIILALKPTNVEGLILKTNLALQEGNTELAEKTINFALQNNPKSDRLYLMKANLSAMQQNVNQAEQALHKAIELAPEKLQNYQALLGFYQRQGDLVKQETFLEEIIEKFPEIPEIHLIMAELRQHPMAI